MIIPLLLCLGAGLMTAVGGILGILVPKTHEKLMGLILALGLGFSAGVMLFISLTELLPEAKYSLQHSPILGLSGKESSFVLFFAAILLCMSIDRITPKALNPHEPGNLSEERGDKLMRLGLVSAFAIALHNFPEGMATLVAASEGDTLGFSVVIAVAIHNFPEGLAVALPIFYATESRLKAFIWALASGLLEPLGAVFCLLLLGGTLSGATMGVSFALIAGIMVFISLDELIPASREFGEHHWSIYGLLSGMFIMGLSLAIF